MLELSDVTKGGTVGKGHEKGVAERGSTGG